MPYGANDTASANIGITTRISKNTQPLDDVSGTRTTPVVRVAIMPTHSQALIIALTMRDSPDSLSVQPNTARPRAGIATSVMMRKSDEAKAILSARRLFGANSYG